jgi:hypothetical protein
MSEKQEAAHDRLMAINTPILPMIAPNGLPLGECTGDDLRWFAKWLTAVVEAHRAIGFSDDDPMMIGAVPPQGDCSPSTIKAYLNWHKLNGRERGPDGVTKQAAVRN